MENIASENWKKISEETLAASRELEEINNKIINKLTDNQINLAHSILEANARFVGGLITSQEYPYFVSNHAALLNNYNETISLATKITGSLLKNASCDYEDWFEESVRKSGKNDWLNA